MSRRARGGVCAKALAMFFALQTLLACASTPPAIRTPTPVYSPEDAALFNDLFRPELFGHPGFSPPELDGLLPERVAAADAVVPVRVVTVTFDGDGERQNYSVVVAPSEAALAGQLDLESVTLRIAGNSPVFPWVEGASRKWVGTQLLLFLKHFHDGPHFHGAPDTPGVRAAVLRARMPNPPTPKP